MARENWDPEFPVPERQRVLVTAPGFEVDGSETGSRLRQRGLILDDAGPRGDRQPSEVAELANTAVAAIVSTDPFTEEVFQASQRLRVIARLGVGIDNIDLEAATRSGVVVTTTPGLNEETCADHAVALLLAAVRRVVEHDASVRRGDWDRGGALTPSDLHGKRVGVVGFGRIGSRVARRLHAFGTEIRVVDPLFAGTPDWARSTLDAVLPWSDILTLHVPLTKQTRRMIAAEELAAMKPSAVLVNTSRGGLVDEQALVEALTRGAIRAAALDVFDHEPPTHIDWDAVPNVVASPHIGGLSTEATEAMARKCVEQVLDVLDGKTPDGIVNPDVLVGDGR